MMECDDLKIRSKYLALKRRGGAAEETRAVQKELSSTEAVQKSCSYNQEPLAGAAR